jgi:hypothetical protein
MRTILILILALFFGSCSQNNSDTKLFFSNSYKFARKCEVANGIVQIPKSFILKKSDHSFLYSNFGFEDSYSKLDVTFDSNSSNQKITEIDLSDSDQVSTVDALYDHEKNIIAGKLASHFYVYIFPIASGYCYMKFKFNDHISEQECKMLFNQHVQEVGKIPSMKKPIRADKLFEASHKITIDEPKLKITEKSVIGNLFISHKTNNAIFASTQEVSFWDCDELLAYYAEFIIPHYDELSDGMVLTIVNHFPSKDYVSEENILIQFVIRRNINNDINIGFAAKLSPVYLSENVNIKNRYAAEY